MNNRDKAEEILNTIQVHGPCVGPACDENIRVIEKALDEKDKAFHAAREVAIKLHEEYGQGTPFKDADGYTRKDREEEVDAEIDRRMKTLK